LIIIKGFNFINKRNNMSVLSCSTWTEFFHTTYKDVVKKKFGSFRVIREDKSGQINDRRSKHNLIDW